VAILARALNVPRWSRWAPRYFPYQTVKKSCSTPARDARPEPSAERLAIARKSMADRAKRHRSTGPSGAPAATATGGASRWRDHIATRDDARESVAQGARRRGPLAPPGCSSSTREDPPNEEEQRAAYQGVIDALEGRRPSSAPWTQAGDKMLPFLPLPKEDNPALGLRGIRSGFAPPRAARHPAPCVLGVKPLSACKIMLPWWPMPRSSRSCARASTRWAAEMGIQERPSLA